MAHGDTTITVVGNVVADPELRPVLERLTAGRMPAIADELEVTQHLLRTWIALYERTAA